MSNSNIYEMVTNKIIEKLEQGIVPWRKPWINGGAVSWKSQKQYRGINAMLLEEGEYATFNQIKEAKGSLNININININIKKIRFVGIYIVGYVLHTCSSLGIPFTVLKHYSNSCDLDESLSKKLRF